MKLGRGLTKLASKLALVGGMLAGCETPDPTISKNIDNNRFGTKTAALTATEVMQDQTPALKASWTQPGDSELGLGRVKDLNGDDKVVVTFGRGGLLYSVSGSSVEDCMTNGVPQVVDGYPTDSIPDIKIGAGLQIGSGNKGVNFFDGGNPPLANKTDLELTTSGKLAMKNSEQFFEEGLTSGDIAILEEEGIEKVVSTGGSFYTEFDMQSEAFLGNQDISDKPVNGQCGVPVKDPDSNLWIAPRYKVVAGKTYCELVVADSKEGIFLSTKKVGGQPAGKAKIKDPRILDGYVIFTAGTKLDYSQNQNDLEIYYKKLPEDVIVNPDTDVVEGVDAGTGVDSDVVEGSDTTDSTDGGVEGTDAIEGTDTTDGTDSSDTADSTDGGVDADVVEPEDIQETPDEVSSPDVEETKEDVKDDIQMPEEVSKDTSEDISEVLDSQTPDVEEVEQCLKELKEFKLKAGDCEISICESEQVADVYLASVLGKTTKTCEAEFTVDGVAGTGVLRFENIKGGQIKVSCSVTPFDPPLCDAENIGSGARIMEDGQGAKMGSKFGAVTGSEASDWSQFLVDATADTQTFEITSFNKPDEPQVFTRLNETTFVVIPSDGKPRTVTVSKDSIDLEELPDFPDVGVKTDIEIHKTDAGSVDSTSPDAGNISKPPAGGGDGGCNAGPFNPGSSSGAALGAMAAVGILMTVRNRRRQKEEAL